MNPLKSVIANSHELAIVHYDSVTITINGLNLSEDFSRLSSKNDEILMLIYQSVDSTISAFPVFSQQLVFTPTNRVKNISLSHSERSNTFLLLFIEQDEETPIEQLDPVFRIHLTKIMNAYANNDIVELEKYLGDEDLLGIKFLNTSNLSPRYTFSFKGIQKMDTYEYVISICGQRL